MIPQELDWTVQRPKYLAAELRVAKLTALILPMIGLATLPFARAIGHFVVALRSPESVVHWRSAVSPMVLASYVGLSAVPVLWLSAARLEARGLLPRRWPWAPCASLLVVAVLCLPFVVPRTQWFFLEAGKVRFKKFSFVRSVAYWQRMSMETPPAKSGHRVALLGSSQMNFAVDRHLMQELMPDAHPEKWSLPGLGIMQYPLIAGDLIERQTDVVVCWLSEFDVFREDRIPANRLRYFADLPELCDLIQTLPWREVWRNRAQLADLASAIVPLWRQRDMVRRLTFDLWWPAQAPGLSSPGGPAPDPSEHGRENLRRSIRRTVLLESNFRAFQRFAQVLASHQIDLWVFEGQTNPLATSVYSAEFRTDTRARLRQMSKRVPFTYVTEEQMPPFDAQDFCDAYHLGEVARECFTRYLATRLTEEDANGH